MGKRKGEEERMEKKKKYGKEGNEGRVEIRQRNGRDGLCHLAKNITGAHDIITPPTLICCTPRDFSLSSLMTTAFAVVN